MLQLSICKKKNPSKVFPFLVNAWTFLYKAHVWYPIQQPLVQFCPINETIFLHSLFHLLQNTDKVKWFKFFWFGLLDWLIYRSLSKFGTPLSLILVRPSFLALLFFIIGVTKHSYTPIYIYRNNVSIYSKLT